MKRKIMAAFLAVLQLLCLCACDPAAPADTTKPSVDSETETAASTTAPVVYDHTTTDVFGLNKWFKYIQTAKAVGVLPDNKEFHIPPTEDMYKVMQGCCTDGTYMYAVLEKKKQDVDGEVRSLCRIVKVQLDTWEVVAISEPLKLDHGNGATYNGKTNEIVVTNCQFDPKMISIVDPETLTVTRTVKLSRKVRGIAYNPEKDQYAVAISGSSDIAIYDANFKELDYYKCEAPGLGNQSISWDGRYLYMTYTGALKSKTRGSEIICCYDWNGNFCGVFRLFTFLELESSFHVNGETYVSFYNDGGKFYRLEMEGIELLTPDNE